MTTWTAVAQPATTWSALCGSPPIVTRQRMRLDEFAQAATGAMSEADRIRFVGVGFTKEQP